LINRVCFMIVFELICKNNHTFEGWFDDNHSFEAQKKQGLLTCPVCDCSEVFKSLTTFGIKKTTTRMPETSHSLTQSESDPGKSKKHDMETLRKGISSFIEKNFDNVGSDFATEALKIHYGVKKPRNIRGSSTEEDDKMLEKEGIPIIKFPVPEQPGDS